MGVSTYYGGDDIAREFCERSPHAGSCLNVTPPISSIQFAVIFFSLRLYILQNIAKRLLKQGCFAFVHLPTEIDDPFVGRTIGLGAGRLERESKGVLSRREEKTNSPTVPEQSSQ